MQGQGQGKEQQGGPCAGQVGLEPQRLQQESGKDLLEKASQEMRQACLAEATGSHSSAPPGALCDLECERDIQEGRPVQTFSCFSEQVLGYLKLMGSNPGHAV